MNTAEETQEQTGGSGGKSPWHKPVITGLSLNKTSSGDIIRAPEQGLFEIFICDTNDPTCDPIFGS